MSGDTGFLGGGEQVASSSSGGGGGSGRSHEEVETSAVAHPLQNPLIMSRILNLLVEDDFTVDDMKHFRSVCKLWKDLVSPLWDSSVKLNLGPPPTTEFKPPEPDNTANPEEYRKCLPITEFINLYQNPDTDPYDFQIRPFTRYVMNGVTIEKCDLLRAPYGDLPDDLPLDIVTALDKLWTILGPIAEEFTFKKCIFSEEAQNENFRKIIGEKLPNLKKLTLIGNRLVPKKIPEEREQWFLDQQLIAIALEEHTPFNEHLQILEVNGETPMDGFELLLNSLNLEALKLRNDTKYDYTLQSLMNMWSLLQKEGEGRISCKLKNLDIIDSHFLVDLWYPIERHLARLQFPLVRISLKLEPLNGYLVGNQASEYLPNNSDDMVKIFIPILEQHKDTLQVLEAFRPPVFAVPAQSPFQLMMPQMRELYLWGNIVNNFAFLKFLPNLKVLHLNHDCYGRGEEMEKLYFPGNQNFDLFQRRYQPYSGDMLGGMSLLQSEAIHMEFMEELELDIRENSPLAIMCLARWMPNLKVFRTNLKKHTFPTVCKVMPKLEELVALFESELDDGVITGRERGGCGEVMDVNNITRLTCLKKFLWKPRCDNNDGGLGESSVHHGFSQLKALKSLIVPVSEHMSEETEAALKQRVPRVRFIRNFGPNPHQKFDNCCQRREFRRNILRRPFE